MHFHQYAVRHHQVLHQTRRTGWEAAEKLEKTTDNLAALKPDFFLLPLALVSKITSPISRLGYSMQITLRKLQPKDVTSTTRGDFFPFSSVAVFSGRGFSSAISGSFVGTQRMFKTFIIFCKLFKSLMLLLLWI
ncbi:MAG: hypothetical protein ACYSWR_06950 [Planctomycetota bacterium]|jgi:hypothetical protein